MMDAYRDVIGATRDFAHGMNGTQEGDPAKAALAIDAALDAALDAAGLDRATRFAPLLAIVVPKDANRSAIGARETDDRVDRRRLAGTVGTQKPEKLPRFDTQRHIVDSGEITVTLDEMVDDDGRCYGTNPLRRR